MKAIVNTGPDKLELREVPTPRPGPGQALIKTAACGICATELQMIAGWDRTGFPAVPGHEWAGVVESVGPGGAVEIVGRSCVAENVLADGGEVGFEHPGGYGAYLVTDVKNLQFLKPDFPPATAALVEPLAVCVRGMRRLRVERARTAAVLGDGPIGLISLMLLRRAGAGRVVLAGGRSNRLALAAGLGADGTVNYHSAGSNMAEAMRRAGGGSAFALVLETSGSAAAFKTAFDIAAPAARILVLGDYGACCADFAWNTVLHKELEIIGSNASAEAWPEAVGIAQEKDFPLARLITHRLPANRFEEGIALMRNRDSGVIKVVLEWQKHGQPEQ